MVTIGVIENSLETIQNIQQTALIIFTVCCASTIAFEIAAVSDRVVYLWCALLFSSALVAFCMTMIIIWS